MKVNFRYLCLLGIALFAMLAGCTADPDENPKSDPDRPQDESEPVALKIDISAADFTDGAESITRSGESRVMELKSIDRLVVLIVKEPESASESMADPYKGRLVAYRSLARPYKDEDFVPTEPLAPIDNRATGATEYRFLPLITDKDGNSTGNGWLRFHENPNWREDYNQDDIRGDANPELYYNVVLNFDNEEPLHYPTPDNPDDEASIREAKMNSVERLRPGHYHIFAIANFAQSNLMGSGEGFGGSDKTVRELCRDLLNRFDPGKGLVTKTDGTGATVEFLDDTDGRNITEFAFYLQQDGDKKTSYMRPSHMNILATGHQRIFLHPGKDNTVSMKLKRIVARSQFKIRNYSDLPLRILEFKLSGNYALGNTYLFRHTQDNYLGWTDNDRKELYIHSSEERIWGQGAPRVNDRTHRDASGAAVTDEAYCVSSSDAFIPFSPDYVYYKTVGNEDTAWGTFFEGLTYESRDDSGKNPFNYTLAIQYAKEIDANGNPVFDEPVTTEESKHYTLPDAYPESPEYQGIFPAIFPTEAQTFSTTPTASLNQHIAGLLKAGFDSEYPDFPYKGEETKLEIGHLLCFNNGTNYSLVYNDNGKIGIETYGSEADWNNYGLNGLRADGKSTLNESYFWNISGDGDGSSNSRNYVQSATYPYYYIRYYNRNVDFGNTSGDLTWRRNGNTATLSNSSGRTYYLYLNESTKSLSFSTTSPGTPILLIPVIYNIELTRTGDVIANTGLQKRITFNIMAYPKAGADTISEELHELNRNDFLKVRIGVSYNPASADINFRVRDWIDKPDNVVEFE